MEHAAELEFSARQIGFDNVGVVVASAASKSPRQEGAARKESCGKEGDCEEDARQTGTQEGGSNQAVGRDSEGSDKEGALGEEDCSDDDGRVTCPFQAPPRVSATTE